MRFAGPPFDLARLLGGGDPVPPRVLDLARSAYTLRPGGAGPPPLLVRRSRPGGRPPGWRWSSVGPGGLRLAGEVLTSGPSSIVAGRLALPPGWRAWLEIVGERVGLDEADGSFGPIALPRGPFRIAFARGDGTSPGRTDWIG